MKSKSTTPKYQKFEDPTPEEIRERCWEIQKEWTPAERRRRGEPSTEVPMREYRMSGVAVVGGCE